MVMHARKPQRMSDGYFEKHQSHPYQSSKYGSKRDYERESSGRSSSSYLRDRDANTASPLMGSHSMNGSGGGPGGPIGSYSRRSSVSPDLDSPPRDHRDRGERGGDSRYSSSYSSQKMRDKERDNRDVYKKDKYLDKRDRRESEHRTTNHDRLDSSGASRRSSNKLALPLGQSNSFPAASSSLLGVEKSRPGSLERDREPRGGDHESSSSSSMRDRSNSDRGTRVGDWSEHVSSSGKKYYYNCKTEVSQWEKPREWLFKERTLGKELPPLQHHARGGDYRDKDRDRSREGDRFSRTTGYGKHSSSSGSTRPGGGRRWPPDSELGVQSSASGHHASRRGGVGGGLGRSHDHDGGHHHASEQDISPEGDDSTPTSEGNYSSHRSTPTRRPEEMMNATPVHPHHHGMHHHHPHHGVGGLSQGGGISSSSSNNGGAMSGVGGGGGPAVLVSTSSLMVNALPRLSSHPVGGSGSTPTGSGVGGPMLSPGSGASTMMMMNNHHGHHHHPSSSSSSSMHHHSVHGRKLMLGEMGTGSGQSPTTGGSSNSINSGSLSNMMMDGGGMGPGRGGGGGMGDKSNVSLANLPQILSQITGNKQIDQTELNPQKALQTINNALLMSSRHHHYSHFMNSNGGLERSVSSPAVGGGGYPGHQDGSVINSSQMLSNLAASHHGSLDNNGGRGTPTQDVGQGGGGPGGLLGEHRKPVDYNSCSSLQGVMAQRNQGPSLTPSLSNCFRADLITHVTNWPADMLEKQAQKLSEEAHLNGDLQCAWVSADLKSARSVVRRTEIIATLYEQKIMYLRQQFQRLEELKSQNSFMSDDL